MDGTPIIGIKGISEFGGEVGTAARETREEMAMRTVENTDRFLDRLDRAARWLGDAEVVEGKPAQSIDPELS